MCAAFRTLFKGPQLSLLHTSWVMVTTAAITLDSEMETTDCDSRAAPATESPGYFLGRSSSPVMEFHMRDKLTIALFEPLCCGFLYYSCLPYILTHTPPKTNPHDVVVRLKQVNRVSDEYT